MCMCTLVWSRIWVRSFWLEVQPVYMGYADPAAHALPLGGNKYYYTILIFAVFLACLQVKRQKVCVIFRTATGSLKQVNSDNSDMYIPVYGSAEYAVRLNLPPFERVYSMDRADQYCCRAETSVYRCCICQFKSYFKIRRTTLTTATGTSISNTPNHCYSVRSPGCAGR